MNIQIWRPILIVIIVSHQVSKASDSEQRYPIMPPIPVYKAHIPSSHFQFGTVQEQKEKKEPRYLTRISPEEYSKLGKREPVRWIWATQQELATLNRTVPIVPAWQEKQQEHERELARQLYNIVTTIGVTTRHARHEKTHRIIQQRKERLEKEIEQLLGDIPADIQAHIQDHYGNIQEFIHLKDELASTQAELSEQETLVSPQATESSIKELRHIWGEPDTYIFRNAELRKGATETKRRETGNPHEELTREEIMQHVLADKFFYAYAHCQNSEECNILEQVFQSIAKKLLAPKERVPQSHPEQFNPNNAPQALKLAQDHLVTTLNVLAQLTSPQNTLDTEKKEEKLTQAMAKLQQSLRIMQAAFPAHATASQACVSHMNRPAPQPESESEDFEIEEEGDVNDSNEVPPTSQSMINKSYFSTSYWFAGNP